MASFIVPVTLSIGHFARALSNIVSPQASQSPRATTEAERVKAFINNELGAFLDQEGIRQDFEVVVAPNIAIAKVDGSNFSKGSARITIVPGFLEADREAFKWVLRHELAHIKNSDALKVPVAAATGSLLALSFVPITSGLSLALLSFLGAFACSNLYAHHGECRADELANKNASIDELKGGIRFLKALRNFNLFCKNHVPGADLMIDEKGDNRIDLSHPSLQSRIDKITKEIESREYLIEDELTVDDHEFVLLSQGPKLVSSNYGDEAQIRTIEETIARSFSGSM